MNSVNKFLFVIVFSIFVTTINAQTIDIRINNIRNTKGKILLSFYTNPDNFPYNPEIKKTIEKSALKNGTIQVSYNDFKPGEYAMTLLDDENEDNDMNYRFFIPQEGYGFSNYVHEGLMPPKFSDCNFNLSQNGTLVNIKVQYW